MSAIPLITFDGGEVIVQRGSLLDCAAEFLTPSQIRYYQSCTRGWSRCPLDHFVYSALDAMGRKVVVPGVIVPSERAPRRKLKGAEVRFEKQAIERFVAPILLVSEEIRSQRDKEFKNLTHDLRAISTEIYHTALAVRESIAGRVEQSILNEMESVLAAQQMMSVRLDIVDYESGHAANRPKEHIAVFKKFEKVYKCFLNKMRHRRVDFRIEGKSFGLTLGPPLMEIVPFVILENAIKYSPYGAEGIMRFEENHEDVVVRIESFGPKIKESEKEKIFEQNFRGEAASAERTGSGIGLYAAKTLVEQHFGGKIFVNQLDDFLSYQGASYFWTRFTIVFPRVWEESSSILRHRAPSRPPSFRPF